MTHDAPDEEAADGPTEALPTTRELPVTQPLPTPAKPTSDAHAQEEPTQVLPLDPGPPPRDAAPPSVPPQGAGAAASASPPAEDAGRRRPTALTAAGVAVGVLVLLGLILGAMALVNDAGSSAGADTSTSATPSASTSASTPSAAADASAPAADQTGSEEAAADVGSDGKPGDDGACTASIRKVDVKDGEFALKVQVKARAGGVETWEVRVDIGEASASDAEKATLVGQTDGVVTVRSEDGAGPIASGKHKDFTLTGTGEPSDLSIACSS